MSGRHFYLASGLANIAKAREVMRVLRSLGYKCTYDWTEHGSLQAMPHRWEQAAVGEIAGVAAADFVVVVMPGGRGTHAELGAALVLERPVIMIGTDAERNQGAPYDCVFHYHPSVHRIADVMQLGEALSEVRQR